MITTREISALAPMITRNISTHHKLSHSHEDMSGVDESDLVSITYVTRELERKTVKAKGNIISN